MGETLELEDTDLQEIFLENGWTDGLPIVAPTPDKVFDFLTAVDAQDPDTLIGYLPARDRGVTLEQAAANAVMAGCAPEHFPIVLAAVEAMFDPKFNLHTVLTSTGGAAICCIVAGPLAAEVKMNARGNLMGHGNRANLAIGRTLRLIGINGLGSVPGVSDASSFGHPGKVTFCFAEDPPPAPWEPLSQQLGYAPEDTTVTLIGSEGPHQFAYQLAQDPGPMLRAFGASISHPVWFSTGKGGHGAMVLGPEHASFCIKAGMSQADVRQALYEAARIDAQWLQDVGVPLEKGSQHEMTPGPDGKVDTIASPDDLLLVTGGLEGAGWSAWIPAWAPPRHSMRATRRVRPTGEAMPDCGPDGCLVPWMK